MKDPRLAHEVAHYDDVARAQLADMGPAVEHLKRFETLGRWCVPSVHDWALSPVDGGSQADAYTHILPVLGGGRVLQLGGTGFAAIKAIMGGANEAVLVTPSAGEAAYARHLAVLAGVDSRFRAVTAVAESLPFSEGAFDAVISEGCLHHTDVARALSESHRVLRIGGRFAAWDPWRTPVYRAGVRLIGKRDPNVQCIPLDQDRLAAVDRTFKIKLQRHGAVFRYPLILAQRLNWRWVTRRAAVLARWDDSLLKMVPALAPWASSVAVLSTKRDGSDRA